MEHLPPAATLGVSAILSGIGWGLLMAWVFWPWLTRRPRREALLPLALVHVFRHISGGLLWPGVAGPGLDRDWAAATWAGDLLTAGLALLAAVALRRGWRAAIALTWLFNTVGTLDLLKNVAMAAHLGVAEHLHAAAYVPAVGVPMMLVVHLAIFALLLRRAD